MTWVRRHALALGVAVLGLLSLAAFTWGDWHTYVNDQSAHHESAAFWSSDFLANWLDNAAQNWHSELLFGVLLVILLNKLEGSHGADRGDT
jgi:hypothetical protein